MKKLYSDFMLLAGVGFLSLFNLSAQPFQTGHTTITFTDVSRNNRNIQTEIYYPASTTGNNVALATGTEDYPLLVFGHGFVMGWDSYENIWQAVVSQGFIIAFPRTETGILPSHLDFGKDLAFVVSQMYNQDNSQSSLFYNRIAEKNAVMGHSMGGGAAFIAAGLNPEITALVTLAPAETNPSAVTAASLLTIPSLVFAGQNDCVTSIATNQQLMYNALQSQCKTIISIAGASHCQMADYNFLCGIGEATCSPSPAISRAEQHQVINNYLLKWLNAKLKNDCASGIQFDNEILTDDAIAYQKNCVLCDPLSVSDPAFSKGIIYPNPFDEKLEISFADQSVKQISVYDSQMRTVIVREFEETIELETDQLNAGLYFYAVTQNDQVLKRGKLIKK